MVFGPSAVLGSQPPAASATGNLQSELGPRPDTEWTRVPRGLRLRPRLPRGFLVMGRRAPNTADLGLRAAHSLDVRDRPRSLA
jgi:hypothetical protein